MDKEQQDKPLELENPAQPHKPFLLVNKWRLILLITILMVIVGGGAYLLGVKQTKLDQQITISPTNVQISPNPDSSATPLPAGELTPDRMVKLTKTAENPNWGNLTWIVVFTNAGEPLPQEIKNDLCNGEGVNKLSYLPTWFKREANKYDISLSLSVKCYDQQIALAQDIIETKDTYSAFGKAIPIPVDREKATKYLVEIIPSLLDYDLITVVYFIGPSPGVADLAGVGNKVSYKFISANPTLVEGVQYYAPNVTEPNISSSPGFIQGVAHEGLHSLGANDHYDGSNFNCSDEPDKSSQSSSIMCATSLNYFTDYIVSSQTAKEIGWTN